MSAPAREAIDDDSTGRRPSRRASQRRFQRPEGLRAGLAALAVLGAILLIVSEFLPLYRIVVGALETERESRVAWRNHGFAMLVLGLAAIPMLVGALRGARPAMWAIAAIGIVAIAIAVAVDLPSATDEGLWGERFEDAEARPAVGFFTETLGGVMLLAAGGLMLLTAPPRDGAAADAI